MILVITPENRKLYAGYLEEMHRVRHKVFVERAKWENLRNPFELDIDEFDKPWVTYFLKIADNGEIVAGLRTLPTSHPYMMNELYYPTHSNLFNVDRLPRDPNIWEMSRYFVVDPEYRTKKGFAAKMELYVAVFEFACSKGVKSLCAVGETYLIARALKLGWNVVPLSLPFYYEQPDFEGEMIAVKIDVDDDMVLSTRNAWQLHHEVIGNIKTKIPERPSNFNAADYVVLSRLVGGRMDVMTDVFNLMRALGSPCAEVRSHAERELDVWITEASAEGFKLDAPVSPTSPSIN